MLIKKARVRDWITVVDREGRVLRIKLVSVGGREDNPYAEIGFDGKVDDFKILMRSSAGQAAT